MKYAPDSKSRLDALALQARSSPADGSSGQGQVEVLEGSVQAPEPEPMETVQEPPPPPGLAVPSPSELQKNILEVLLSLGVAVPPVGESGGTKRGTSTPSVASTTKLKKKKKSVPSSTVSVAPPATASDGQGATGAASVAEGPDDRSRIAQDVSCGLGLLRQGLTADLPPFVLAPRPSFDRGSLGDQSNLPREVLARSTIVLPNRRLGTVVGTLMVCSGLP